MPDPVEVPRRMTRADAAGRTRELLLESAREVFVEHGYQSSSIYEIAKRAGRTIGALYSHFGGKEGVFLALWDRDFAQLLDGYRAQARGAGDLGDAPAEAGDFWIRFLQRDPDLFRLFVEFWSHALREPDLRPRFAESLRQLRAAVAEVIEQYQRTYGISVAAAPTDIALVIESLVDGFSLHKLADPEHVDSALLGRALGWMVQGLLAERGAAPPADV
ncbi:TetR/AcrR family transcriptional regulator [Pseudonocardia sp. CA-107938]|uniref:TetR/AcrR family transcriptional regulator n=1 Tax=Pseudonocardia sp. CA-107938 TaxID=3240021 RepID=UPI003D90D0C8